MEARNSKKQKRSVLVDRFVRGAFLVMTLATIVWKLGWLPKMVGRFGLMPGLKQYLGVFGARLFRRNTSVYTLDVPGLKKPIQLRRKSSDILVFEQVFIDREYDIKSHAHRQHALDIYNGILRKGRKPLIIDCGANIGLTSLFFASVYPKAKICAVEPDPANFSILMKNTAQIDDIIAVQAGVWDKNVGLTISNPQVESWGFQLSEATMAEENKISSVTMPQILNLDSTSEVFIVKIDIEGGERNLFMDNAQWISTAPIIIVEIHDWLMPWKFTGHAVFSVTTKVERDYLFRGDNVFCVLPPKRHSCC